VAGEANLNAKSRLRILGFHRTSMDGNRAFRDRQAQARAPGLTVPVRFHAVKGLENILQGPIRNAWPAVPD
jgi:hypothetical protein